MILLGMDAQQQTPGHQGFTFVGAAPLASAAGAVR